MYYNKWMSSSVKHRLKQHALQVLKISLTIVTTHVWKHAGLLASFSINKNFQDTLLHHTSLTSWARHWSHYLLLKEKITHSQGYLGGSNVKTSLACTNEGVFIAKGETDPCGCSTTFMTVWLPWPFDFTWLFMWQVGLLDFHISCGPQ